MNPRQEIVSLLRGYAACPVLSLLDEMGVLDHMREGRFTADAFPPTAGSAAGGVLRYLEGLGLIQPEAGADPPAYAATPLGQAVFRRSGAFGLLHSYRDYFERLRDLLTGEGPRPHVNRLRNVRGSGRLHARKFFPAALDALDTIRPAVVADLGCGDGCFLSSALDRCPAASGVAVDQSEVAVKAALDRLRGRAVRGMVADAADVGAWAPAVPAGCETLVSLWFVAHEFSGGRPAQVVEFFRRLHQRLPKAHILMGEIVSVPADVLAMGHAESIMPEFLLFHSLSGQGVLTWEQHQQVLRLIPYELSGETRFDELAGQDGAAVPSSFLWQLRPRRSDASHL